jgi:hypothetical protein
MNGLGEMKGMWRNFIQMMFFGGRTMCFHIGDMVNFEIIFCLNLQKKRNCLSFNESENMIHSYMEPVIL